MNRNIIIIFSAAFVIAAALCAAGQEDAAQGKIDAETSRLLAQGEEQEIPVIVMLNADYNDPDDFIPGLDVRYRYRLIPGLAGRAEASAIEEMAKDDRISAIYYDRDAQLLSPSPSMQGSTIDGNHSDEPSSEDYVSPARTIRADRLWEKGIDGRGTVVAVIDSGIDKNHPDLVGRVVAEKNFLADEITADDLLGHGTMVAGIIAGSGAASAGRYRGIAPGASLLSVKVIDSNGDGKVSDIIAGIEWAVYSGADVLSLSLGGINLGESNPPITMAADNAADAGVVVCVAAGNRNSSESSAQLTGSSASQVAGSQSQELSSDGGDDRDLFLLLVPVVVALPPGLIDSPGDGVKVITVGAADRAGRIAGFSGSGPTRDDRVKPDVVAPGVDIISTAPSALNRPVYVDDYYARESGTSLSTPVAAGLAALLLGARQNLSSAGVKAAMTGGAVKLNNSLGESYEEYYQGAGMLDALRAFDIVNNTRKDAICGVIPDQWNAGRWAYLPSGEGVYVGLYTGADRPQKKLYALAPGDEDWNLRFVFFSDGNISDLWTSAQGDVGDWMSLQPLPESIQANDQKVFAASIKVPDDAPPGVYNGSINIAAGDESLLDIPVSVRVAEALDLTLGLGEADGSLQGNGWDYYYLDVKSGDSELAASLNWSGEGELGLFLLSPTSEYYSADGLADHLADSSAVNSGEKSPESAQGRMKTEKIDRPTSGRWLIAVHSENTTEPTDYALHIERMRIEMQPLRWNLASAPGSVNANRFTLKNFGPSLNNLSCSGVIENTTSEEMEGHVLYKEVWERSVNATETTKKISARLLSDDLTNSSELMLVFENPQGQPVDAALDTGDLGPLEVSNPENGTWKVKVYGYDVPDAGQSFTVLYKEYEEDRWGWIETECTGQLLSNESGTVYANLSVPKDTSLSRLDGYIKITSDIYSFEIPVSVTIAGSRLKGMPRQEVYDTDGDGLFDVLSLGFDVNITAGGEYRLRGAVTDCRGERIGLIDQSERLPSSGIMAVNISGRDIWKRGRCGPLQVENLILYDSSGSFIDRYEENIAINYSPDQFQPPDAYLTGEYINLTTSSAIAIGVNVTVTRPGRYSLQGMIVDDYDDVMGEAKAEASYSPGNATMTLQFDPGRFKNREGPSAVYLVEVVLSRDGVELESMDEAWRSEEMNPQAFASAAMKQSSLSGRGIYARLGAANATSGMRIENGTAIIS